MPTRPLDLLYAMLGGKERARRLADEMSRAKFREPTRAEVAGYTIPLLVLVQTCTDPVVEMKNSFIRSRNKFGVTLLHKSLRYPNWKSGRYLIERDVDLCGSKDDLGRLPLHDACWNEEIDFEIIDLLLRYDPSSLLCPDNRGHTPLCYAPRQAWAAWAAFFERRQEFFAQAFSDDPKIRAKFALVASLESAKRRRPGDDGLAPTGPGSSDSSEMSSDERCSSRSDSYSQQASASDASDGDDGGGQPFAKRRRPDAHTITPPSPTKDGVPEKSPSTRWAEVARTVLASNGIVVEDAVRLSRGEAPA